MLQLNTLRRQPGATHKKKRLGRGAGSGHGQTAGKGDKGQLARSGGHVRPGFEGGQMPLYRRIPKRGFKNPGARDEAILNLGDLERVDMAALGEVNLDNLTKLKVIKGTFDRLIILGNGDIKTAITVKAHRISESAREKITKAGGKFEVLRIPGAQPRAKKKKALTT